MKKPRSRDGEKPGGSRPATGFDVAALKAQFRREDSALRWLSTKWVFQGFGAFVAAAPCQVLALWSAAAGNTLHRLCCRRP
jgi:hypothetical protein